MLSRYKYDNKKGWARILARLLVGYLELNLNPQDVDLIIANPPNPGRDHTTRVIQMATISDLDRKWPFDTIADPTIIKSIETSPSANQKFAIKKQAAKEHIEALKLNHEDRIKGKRILVYDDVCTTGLQLNYLAEQLLQWGAQSVSGIVLARQPWK